MLTVDRVFVDGGIIPLCGLELVLHGLGFGAELIASSLDFCALFAKLLDGVVGQVVEDLLRVHNLGIVSNGCVRVIRYSCDEIVMQGDIQQEKLQGDERLRCGPAISRVQAKATHWGALSLTSHPIIERSVALYCAAILSTHLFLYSSITMAPFETRIAGGLKPKQAPALDATRKFSQVSLFPGTFHKTGFIEDISGATGSSHKTSGEGAASEADSSSDDDSDVEIKKVSDNEDAEGEELSKRLEEIAAKTDEEILGQAHANFDQGRNTTPHNMSNPKTLRATPEEFARKGIVFMPHQLSETGRLRTILSLETVTPDDEDAGTIPDGAKGKILLQQLLGCIIAFEMGTGKTMVAIGRYTSRSTHE